MVDAFLQAEWLEQSGRAFPLDPPRSIPRFTEIDQQPTGICKGVVCAVVRDGDFLAEDPVQILKSGRFLTLERERDDRPALPVPKLG